MLLNILGRGSDQGAHAHYGYIVTIATKHLDREQLFRGDVQARYTCRCQGGCGHGAS